MERWGIGEEEVRGLPEIGESKAVWMWHGLMMR